MGPCEGPGEEGHTGCRGRLGRDGLWYMVARRVEADLGLTAELATALGIHRVPYGSRGNITASDGHHEQCK